MFVIRFRSENPHHCARARQTFSYNINNNIIRCGKRGTRGRAGYNAGRHYAYTECTAGYARTTQKRYLILYNMYVLYYALQSKSIYRIGYGLRANAKWGRANEGECMIVIKHEVYQFICVYRQAGRMGCVCVPYVRRRVKGYRYGVFTTFLDVFSDVC